VAAPTRPRSPSSTWTTRGSRRPITTTTSSTPKLVDLGLEPHLLSDTLIESLFEITKRYAHRVRLEALRPTINWREPNAG
jgi:hypothetical protein